MSYVFTKKKKKKISHLGMAADQTVGQFSAQDRKTKTTRPEKNYFIFSKMFSSHFEMTANQAIK